MAVNSHLLFYLAFGDSTYGLIMQATAREATACEGHHLPVMSPIIILSLPLTRRCHQCKQAKMPARSLFYLAPLW